MVDIAPYDNRDGFIWLDGKMVPWREAKVHGLAHGLHYGTGVFEGERSNKNGVIFKSVEHTERFFRSAETIHMPLTVTLEQIEAAKYEVLEANKLKEAYVRVLGFRGPEQMGVHPGPHAGHVMVAAWYWGKYFGADGLTLVTSKWRKADPSSVPVTAKAVGNYVVNTMVKQEAMKAGYGDALMLHLNGTIAESTGANIFFIDKRGEIHTPIAKGRFLDGITRLTVIDLARELGIKVTERDIQPSELANMAEVFVTGTAAEVTPVVKIDNQNFAAGPIAKKLAEAYADLFASRQRDPARKAANG